MLFGLSFNTAAHITAAQLTDCGISDWRGKVIEARSAIKDVLNTTRDDIKKNYYDTQFHRLDIDSRFQVALEKIQSASTPNYAISDIAGAVTALNDSHTIFLPPPRPYVHEYGWRMQAEGDSDCFITSVQPNSDAAGKE
jgi:hypothetical protein